MRDIFILYAGQCSKLDKIILPVVLSDPSILLETKRLHAST